MTGKMIKRDICEFFPEEKHHLMRDCLLICPEDMPGRVRFSLAPDRRLREGYRVEITNPGFRGQMHVLLGPGTGQIRIDTAGPVSLDVRMFRETSLTIGRGTTINGARIVCDYADVVIGCDGLWSDEIIVQSNDQHGIVDLTTGEVMNAGRRRIEIGDHVWIGRRTTIMPDVAIGRGGILATGAVLTSDMPGNTIFAGVPARQIRDDVSWSRSPGGFVAKERSILELEDIGPQDGPA
jgi:acetyltransferase-like isoleucine patch superfamily enzyme